MFHTFDGRIATQRAAIAPVGLATHTQPPRARRACAAGTDMALDAWSTTYPPASPPPDLLDVRKLLGKWAHEDADAAPRAPRDRGFVLQKSSSPHAEAELQHGVLLGMN